MDRKEHLDWAIRMLKAGKKIHFTRNPKGSYHVLEKDGVHFYSPNNNGYHDFQGSINHWTSWRAQTEYTDKERYILLEGEEPYDDFTDIITR